MSRPLLLAVIFLLLALPAGAVDTERLLRAIAEVETGHNPRAVGRAGERTVYQFTPATWRRLSRVPVSRAEPAEIDRVARALLCEIQTSILQHHITPTPYELALRWNAGAQARRFSSASRDYAARVANLYHAEAALLARD